MNQLLRVAASGAMLIASLHSHAFDFSVSTSSEFQSALTTAASNGGDDVITLAPGVYPGNFKYLASEAYALTIQGDPNAKREDVILDGERRAFVLRVDAREYDMSLTIRNLTVANGKSDEPGGGLALFGGSEKYCDSTDGEWWDELTQPPQNWCPSEYDEGHLTLDELEVRDNYAPHGAGVLAVVSEDYSRGWYTVKLNNSRFSGNGKYRNPLQANNGDFGGGTAAHIALSSRGLGEVTKNEFLDVAVSLVAESQFDSPNSTIFRYAVSLDTWVISDNLFSIPGKVYLDDGSDSVTPDAGIDPTTGTDPIAGTDPVARTDLATGTDPATDAGAATGTSFVGTVAGVLRGSFQSFERNRIIGFEGGLDSAGDDTLNLYGKSEGSRVEGNVVSGNKGTITIYADVVEDNFFGNTFVEQSVGYYSGSESVINLDASVIRKNQFRDIVGTIDLVGSSKSFGALSGTEFQQTLVASENLFDGVKSKQEGGSTSFCAVFVKSDVVNIVNNTIARAEGSGLCIPASSEIMVANNIVWPAPGAQGGLDIQLIGYADKSVLVNNIFQSATEFWDVNEGNLNLDPQYFDVEAGDLHVRAGSPAINAGAGDQLSADQVYDLDGNARVLDGVVDIGAYERSTTALHPADTNGDNEISSEEFAAYNAAWRANDIWETAPALIPIDYVSRAGYLLQSGGKYENIGVGKPATWVPVSN